MFFLFNALSVQMTAPQFENLNEARKTIKFDQFFYHFVQCNFYFTICIFLYSTINLDMLETSCNDQNTLLEEFRLQLEVGNEI